MTTKNSYWMKLHTGVLDNPKFMKLSDATKWHYLALSLTAKRAEAGGWLIWDDITLTIEDLAFQLRTDIDELRESIEVLVKAEFLYFEKDILVISRWEELQDNESDSAYAERVREQTRVRVAKHRAKIDGTKEQEEEEKRIEEKRIEEEKKRKEKKSNVTCNVTPSKPSFPLEKSSSSSEEEHDIKYWEEKEKKESKKRLCT